MLSCIICFIVEDPLYNHKTKSYMQFEQQCKYTKGTATKKDRALYWNKVAGYADIGFQCSHDLKQTHYIGGNLFNEAHKALDCCEFKRVSTDPAGDCGFDAIAMAMTSCQKFVDHYINGQDKEEASLPTTVSQIRRKCANYLSREADDDLLQQAILHWTEFADAIKSHHAIDRDYKGNVCSGRKKSNRKGKKGRKSSKQEVGSYQNRI